MRHRSLHRCCGCVLAALLLSLTHGARAEAAERVSATAPSPAAMGEYRRKLEEYTLARGKYEAEADAYWGSIADKRKLRRAKRRNNQDVVLGDYVLTQPPVYSGPPKPVDPSAPPEEVPQRNSVPLWPDFWRAAGKKSIFVPQQPRGEMEYKRPSPKPASAA